MPFTPFHMGPGLAIKALMQGAFSLMVFGWTQILMDIQPLVVMLTGSGHLHGFSHTYIGASLIAIAGALSGKYLGQFGLGLVHIDSCRGLRIDWWVAAVSAFIGAGTHVLLDSLMHADIQPFFPFTADNSLLGLMSVQSLHRLCIWSGLAGAVLFVVVSRRFRRRRGPAEQA